MQKYQSPGPAWLGLVSLAFGFTEAATTASVVPKLRADDVLVQRVEKILVATDVKLFKRVGSLTCPTEYSLCPATLSGGCCPDGYACETDSCLQTNPATTASACGIQGYVNCGVSAGGGCCPYGYICGVNECTAPPGVSQSQQCPTGYYLCPASYNYGCCETTMGCALNACYATTPKTFVFTATFTTSTGAGGKAAVTTVTSTTVQSPTAPSGLPTTDTSIYLAKFLPSTQAKVSEVAATGTSTSSSSGLTSAQIGGLIGGLVALLIIVLVAAFFIIRSLRKTRKAVKQAERRHKASSGGGGSGSGKSSSRHPDKGGSGNGARHEKPAVAHANQPTPSQIDQMDYDDLLESAAGETTVGGATPSTSGLPHAQNASNMTGATSPSPGAHAFGHASSDYSSLSGGAGAPLTGYFDLPMRVSNRPGRRSLSTDPRTSIDSQGVQQPTVWQQQYTRPRIVSDATERSGSESAGVGSPLLPAELGVDGGFIPELPSASHSGITPAESDTTAELPDQSQNPARPRPFSNISTISGVSSFVPGAQQQQQGAEHARNWSDSSNSMTGFVLVHNRERSGSSVSSIQGQPQQQQQQQPRLDAVSEAAEHLHGHYGPTNVAAGQTRAAADVDIDISSPIAP